MNDLLRRLQEWGLTTNASNEASPEDDAYHAECVAEVQRLQSDPRAKVPIRVEPTRRGFPVKALDFTRPPEPLEWAVEKVFLADSVNLLVAPPSSLKTWVLLSLGLALASGEPWLNVYKVD